MAQKETPEELTPEDRDALRQYFIGAAITNTGRSVSRRTLLEIAREQLQFEKDNF